MQSLRHLVTFAEIIYDPQALAALAGLPSLISLSLRGYSPRRDRISGVALPDIAFPALQMLTVICGFPSTVQAVWSIAPLVRRLTTVDLKIHYNHHSARTSPGWVDSVLLPICVGSPDVVNLRLHIRGRRSYRISLTGTHIGLLKSLRLRCISFVHMILMRSVPFTEFVSSFPDAQEFRYTSETIDFYDLHQLAIHMPHLRHLFIHSVRKWDRPFSTKDILAPASNGPVTVYSGWNAGRDLVKGLEDTARWYSAYDLAKCSAERAQGGPAEEHSYPTQTSERPYEMNSYSQPATGYTNTGSNSGGGETEMTRFYDEITAIQDLIHSYRDNIKTISDLQSRSLTATDDDALRRATSELDGVSAQTQEISSEIKRRIQALEAGRGKVSGRDREAWIQQTNVVKSRFVAAIQEYQQAEQQYRQKSRQRMERQVRIVKPDATQEEIAAVVNDEGGAQVFSQALMSSNRYGESRLAYREVQQRHDDVKKIEKTLTELAQLFSDVRNNISVVPDMSVMVAQQDETIDAIETHAARADKDMENGLEQTDKAVDHARAARRKRWICFWITLAILAVIAIILAVTLSKLIPQKDNK
ncbi:Plasma membrane t-SNARE, secretory vesicle fusion [Ceratobasidium sp. 370]|nr:Plasma membrane t-SNARE, secretory vesicle fusion [Ceratobasidium sp. 370]